MAVEISSLLEASSDVRDGRMCIAGTGITVHRIASWWNLGWTPEEIAANYAYISLASVLAALAYYEANKDEIDSQLQRDEEESAALAKAALNGRSPGAQAVPPVR